MHMRKISRLPEPITLLPYIGKWTLLAGLVAVLSGTASAFFLFALDYATHWREAHRWIIWLLPLAGFAVGWVYLKLGSSVEAGNNLLIDEIHDPKGLCKDVTGIGRWGNGDVEVGLSSAAQLDDVMALVKQAFDKQFGEEGG